MKILGEYVIKNIGDLKVVVPINQASVELDSILTLNDTAAFLFNLLLTERTQEELLSMLLEEYDIDEVTAKKDIKHFIDMIQKIGILDV